MEFTDDDNDCLVIDEDRLEPEQPGQQEANGQHSANIISQTNNTKQNTRVDENEDLVNHADTSPENILRLLKQFNYEQYCKNNPHLFDEPDETQTIAQGNNRSNGGRLYCKDFASVPFDINLNLLTKKNIECPELYAHLVGNVHTSPNPVQSKNKGDALQPTVNCNDNPRHGTDVLHIPGANNKYPQTPTIHGNVNPQIQSMYTRPAANCTDNPGHGTDVLRLPDANKTFPQTPTIYGNANFQTQSMYANRPAANCTNNPGHGTDVLPIPDANKTFPQTPTIYGNANFQAQSMYANRPAANCTNNPGHGTDVLPIPDANKTYPQTPTIYGNANFQAQSMYANRSNMIGNYSIPPSGNGYPINGIRSENTATLSAAQSASLIPPSPANSRSSRIISPNPETLNGLIINISVPLPINMHSRVHSHPNQLLPSNDKARQLYCHNIASPTFGHIRSHCQYACCQRPQELRPTPTQVRGGVNIPFCICPEPCNIHRARPFYRTPNPQVQFQTGLKYPYVHPVNGNAIPPDGVYRAPDPIPFANYHEAYLNQVRSSVAGQQNEMMRHAGINTSVIAMNPNPNRIETPNGMRATMLGPSYPESSTHDTTNIGNSGNIPNAVSGPKNIVKKTRRTPMTKTVTPKVKTPRLQAPKSNSRRRTSLHVPPIATNITSTQSDKSNVNSQQTMEMRFQSEMGVIELSYNLNDVIRVQAPLHTGNMRQTETKEHDKRLQITPVNISKPQAYKQSGNTFTDAAQTSPPQTGMNMHTERLVHTQKHTIQEIILKAVDMAMETPMQQIDEYSVTRGLQAISPMSTKTHTQNTIKVNVDSSEALPNATKASTSETPKHGSVVSATSNGIELKAPAYNAIEAITDLIEIIDLTSDSMTPNSKVDEMSKNINQMQASDTQEIGVSVDSGNTQIPLIMEDSPIQAEIGLETDEQLNDIQTDMKVNNNRDQSLITKEAYMTQQDNVHKNVESSRTSNCESSLSVSQNPPRSKTGEIVTFTEAKDILNKDGVQIESTFDSFNMEVDPLLDTMSSTMNKAGDFTSENSKTNTNEQSNISNDYLHNQKKAEITNPQDATNITTKCLISDTNDMTLPINITQIDMSLSAKTDPNSMSPMARKQPTGMNFNIRRLQPSIPLNKNNFGTEITGEWDIKTTIQSSNTDETKIPAIICTQKENVDDIDKIEIESELNRLNIKSGMLMNSLQVNATTIDVKNKETMEIEDIQQNSTQRPTKETVLTSIGADTGAQETINNEYMESSSHYNLNLMTSTENVAHNAGNADLESDSYHSNPNNELTNIVLQHDTVYNAIQTTVQHDKIDKTADLFSLKFLKSILHNVEVNSKQANDQNSSEEIGDVLLKEEKEDHSEYNEGTQTTNTINYDEYDKLNIARRRLALLNTQIENKEVPLLSDPVPVLNEYDEIIYFVLERASLKSKKEKSLDDDNCFTNTDSVSTQNEQDIKEINELKTSIHLNKQYSRNKCGADIKRKLHETAVIKDTEKNKRFKIPTNLVHCHERKIFVDKNEYTKNMMKSSGIEPLETRKRKIHVDQEANDSKYTGTSKKRYRHESDSTQKRDHNRSLRPVQKTGTSTTAAKYENKKIKKENSTRRCFVPFHHYGQKRFMYKNSRTVNTRNSVDRSSLARSKTFKNDSSNKRHIHGSNSRWKSHPRSIKESAIKMSTKLYHTDEAKDIKRYKRKKLNTNSPPLDDMKLFCFQIEFFRNQQEYFKTKGLKESAELLSSEIHRLIDKSNDKDARADMEFKCPKCNNKSIYSPCMSYYKEHNVEEFNKDGNCQVCFKFRKRYMNSLRKYIKDNTPQIEKTNDDTDIFDEKSSNTRNSKNTFATQNTALTQTTDKEELANQPNIVTGHNEKNTKADDELIHTKRESNNQSETSIDCTSKDKEENHPKIDAIPNDKSDDEIIHTKRESENQSSRTHFDCTNSAEEIANQAKVDAGYNEKSSKTDGDVVHPSVSIDTGSTNDKSDDNTLHLNNTPKTQSVYSSTQSDKELAYPAKVGNERSEKNSTIDDETVKINDKDTSSQNTRTNLTSKQTKVTADQPKIDYDAIEEQLSIITNGVVPTIPKNANIDVENKRKVTLPVKILCNMLKVSTVESVKKIKNDSSNNKSTLHIANNDIDPQDKICATKHKIQKNISNKSATSASSLQNKNLKNNLSTEKSDSKKYFEKRKINQHNDVKKTTSFKAKQPKGNSSKSIDNAKTRDEPTTRKITQLSTKDMNTANTVNNDNKKNKSNKVTKSDESARETKYIRDRNTKARTDNKRKKNDHENREARKSFYDDTERPPVHLKLNKIGDVEKNADVINNKSDSYKVIKDTETNSISIKLKKIRHKVEKRTNNKVRESDDYSKNSEIDDTDEEADDEIDKTAKSIDTPINNNCNEKESLKHTRINNTEPRNYAKVKDEYSYKCHVCTALFSYRRVYRKHMSKHGIHNKPIPKECIYKKCQICNMKVKKATYNYHIRTCHESIYNVRIEKQA